jgi:hypothetical protein
MSDIPREFASVVMDASQKQVRKYWNGAGWVHDPTEAKRSKRDHDGMAHEYLELRDSGCQVALASIEYSRIDGVVTVHEVRVWERRTLAQGIRSDVLRCFNQGRFR